MTYTADLSTLARIDSNTYAVTLRDAPYTDVRVYFEVVDSPVGRIAVASIDIAGTLDCWRAAVGSASDLRRRTLALAAKNVPHCWAMDDLDGFTGFYAYIPE